MKTNLATLQAEIERLRELSQTNSNKIRENENATEFDKQRGYMALGKSIAYSHVLILIDEQMKK